MTTMRKFKVLATHCAAAAGSPTRSPTTSPVIHLRRRKTLRMLLGRGSPDRSGDLRSPEKPKELSVRHKLKDLLVSSPSSPPPMSPASARNGLLPLSGGGVRTRRGNRLSRPVTVGFRQRLLRRAWRPMLVGIPE